MVLIAACDGLAPQNKPTSWSEGEARLEIVEKQGDLEVQPEVQRHLSALKGKEVLHDVLAVQEEIIEETFKFYNDITMPFFLDTDLQAVEGQPNQRSLPTWSSTTVSLRYSICTDAEDAANAIQAHRDCLLNDGSYDLCRAMKSHGRSRERGILWLKSILRPWDENEDERQTWKSQAVQAYQQGVAFTMNCMRGVLRVLSDIPGDMGSEVGHLELALPGEFMRKGVGARGAPSEHLGTLNRAGAVIQKHMLEDKEWRTMRQAAEAAKNADHQMTPEYKHLCEEMRQCEEMVRSFQKNARSESIVRQVSKMQESGIRPSGCKELWDSICVAITTDLDEIEQEAERHSEAPQLVPDLQQMQSMLNIMPPAHADVVSLHTRASSIVSGLQTKHAASGLETLLTKSSLSATDLKSLMQHYQSASAAGQITSDTGKKMMDIRPTVFRCIVDKCCHSSEKFSESMISVEVSILDAFNTNTLVVKAAGGRSADAGNIHAMRDLPRKASALRLALFRTEAAEDKGEVEHCCTELLPQLAKASEAFTEASLKYQGDDLRQKLSKEFFPHIDALDGGMHKWERKAETLVSKFATIQCNHAIDSLKDLAKAFARTAGGHNTMEGKNWYHGLATAELNKIASLHQQFKDTLAQAEIADTIDQDLAKIKKKPF